MTRDELLQVVKDTALALIERENVDGRVDLDAWRARLDRELVPDAPLAHLGWDSLRMTWLLVRLEETLQVDASTLSLYDLFTVGDLLDQLLELVKTLEPA
jgi:acyl carrier protein